MRSVRGCSRARACRRCISRRLRRAPLLHRAALRRAARYSHGEQVLWLGGTARDARRAARARARACRGRVRDDGPRPDRQRDRRRDGAARARSGSSACRSASSISGGSTTGGSARSTSLAWLNAQWAVLGAEVVSAMLTIVAARRACRALPALVARSPRRSSSRSRRCSRSAARSWLGAAGTHPLREPVLRGGRRRGSSASSTSAARRCASRTSRRGRARRTRSPSGSARRRTSCVWDTLLDGRFSRGEEDVVIAHELGHVRSRHILKAIGWTRARSCCPTLWLRRLRDAPARRAGRPGEPAARVPRARCPRAR